MGPGEGGREDEEMWCLRMGKDSEGERKEKRFLG